ncbi:RNA polymerase sigma factor [Amycolatopsis sp. YIM 10]|uniref:RNA polymerase sigma factor n=1 Tax=Amycolatopsis sp. YIM 10 TaxID=2653857 RepID=UPI0012903E26|nr:sigma-70 family RNA polymerase sigma factor [Amycolatopsis sp. YIM 10]QFU89970.1 hypothetical protein YIM_23965 [Amycolatopsis sp. YIM 10]
MPPTTNERLTDAALMDAVRAGNLLAYGVLCQRHAEHAHGFAKGLHQLLATIHRLAGDQPGVPTAEENLVRRWYAQLADTAFRQLPPRWQLVLWHLETGRSSTEDLAAVLGTSPGGAAALIKRVRADIQARTPFADRCPAWPQTRIWLGEPRSRHRDPDAEEHIATCASCLSASIRLLKAKPPRSR